MAGCSWPRAVGRLLLAAAPGTWAGPGAGVTHWRKGPWEGIPWECWAGHPSLEAHSVVAERGAWNVSKVYGSWLDPVLALLRSGGSSTHIPAATVAWESPAPPSLALPLLHFPHPDFGVSFQTPVLERNPSAFPRDQRFPRPSLPGVPAFPTPPCLCLFFPGPFQVFICL